MRRGLVRSLLAILLCLAGQWNMVTGHGRLIDPPSRASMWKYGFDNPPNYDDTAMYCGGFSAQWEINGGRCGVCGDRYDRPREHEAGGKYANGIIVRHFREGETITVNVELTQSHKGYFEFRLCPNNNPSRRITQQCLDRHLLRQPDGSTRFHIATFGSGVYSVRLVLSKGLTCTQCVLQWKYNAGNSWGCEGVGPQKTCCTGCGRQEQFYACADIDITSASGSAGGSQGVAIPTPYRPQQQQQQTGQLFGVFQRPNLNNGQAQQQQQFVPRPHVPSSPGTGAVLPVLGSANSNLQQATNAWSLYYAQCRGVTDALTSYCLRVCQLRLCSRLYCSEPCQRLLLSPD